jgi:photosystem II stability/assembly factor-like uncharacterized protein
VRPPLVSILAALAIVVVAVLATHAADVHHIHGLAIDRGNPETLYVATHTGLVRLAPGAEPAWIGEQRFDLMGFTAHPSDPNVVWASGHPDTATYRREGVANLGLLASRDGGRTWQSVALRGQVDFHALAWSPRDGGTLYGWSVAAEPGLYRIATKTWAATRVDTPGLGDVLALSASADANGPLLAGTIGGLRISRDGGQTWARVRGFPPAAATAVAHHPSDAQVVYAYAHGTIPGRGRGGDASTRSAGLVRSRDGGETWESTGFSAGPETPVIAIALGPDDRVAVATTAADVLVSRDGGRTWGKRLERGRVTAR